jgi:lipopolysaccharide export system permease protein
MSHDLELQSIRASGFGLIPLIAPIVLLSLAFTLFSFYNNAFLAPQTMTTFKRSLIDLGRNNPTVFLRAQEPIDQFDDFLIYVDKKYGNTIEGVNIWELNDDNVPVTSLRAEKGTISANLQDLTLNITLSNVRQEMRDRNNPSDLTRVQAGMSAESFPLSLSLGKLLDDTRITQDITILPFIELGSRILSPSGLINNPLPLLTELQRRLAFSFASFTFVIIGIPLAITAQRRETAAGIILSLIVAISYYLLIVLATALKDKAAAHPELIVWMPNLIFQTLGFFLLWKMNRQPV